MRVFFRVFASQSPDTDFDPNGTYASTPDPAGHPGTPQPGAGQTTVPFFATANAASETDYQTNSVNNQTVTIPAGQDQTYAYYGCFLNFYDPANTVGGQQVQTLFPGTHHCIVAEIAYDDAPIPSGVSPMSWDQLAQRNLQLTLIDNPGPAATHRAPQTFDLRPSSALAAGRVVGLPPDELMIDWGAVPLGSVASIYWPAVSAADVIELAGQWGGAYGLTASDAHTLNVTVEGGVTYIPIPEGTGQNFAGLFTLEVPVGVRTGQEFEVIVRRLSSRPARGTPPPSPPPEAPATARQTRRKTASTNAAPKIDVVDEPTESEGNVVAVKVEQPAFFRQVVGSFIVRIPVSTGEAMLIPEQMTLAVMKWRMAHLSPGNRWHPVLDRYIKYCAARLEGIGGDPSAVPASLDWHPEVRPPHRGDADAVCGKVVEVLFDCHGEFEGFVLDECCSRRLVHSRERAVGELALRAARENLTLCVRFCADPARVESITVVAA